MASLVRGLRPSILAAPALFATYKVDCEARPSNLRRKMTAIGHFSLISETEFNPSIATFVMKLSGPPLTPSDFCRLWKERQMPELHPRFHQRIESPGYFQSKCSIKEPVEDHVTETLYPVDRKELQSRVQYFQTTRWDLTNTLWEIYICVKDLGLLVAPKETETMLLFRGHHALGDGASLGAALLDLFDEGAEYRTAILKFWNKRQRKARSLLDRLKRKLQQLIWFFFGSIQALAYQLKLFVGNLVCANPWNMLRQPDTIDRVVSFTGPIAPVDQVKWVAHTLAGKRATVNDVFLSCVNAALVKQLQEHRRRVAVLETTLPTMRYMNVSVPVHLKGGVVLPGESVGNNLGAFVARLPGEKGPTYSPVDRFRAVHEELYGIKRTPVAILSHLLAKALSYSSQVLPTSLTAWIFSRANAGSVAVVTNTRGPSEPVHLGGRKIESLHGFVPLPPRVPIGVVVGSYAGNMFLTLTAEPWAVPDPDQFLVDVIEEYKELLEAARIHSGTRKKK